MNVIPIMLELAELKRQEDCRVRMYAVTHPERGVYLGRASGFDLWSFDRLARAANCVEARIFTKSQVSNLISGASLSRPSYAAVGVMTVAESASLMTVTATIEQLDKVGLAWATAPLLRPAMTAVVHPVKGVHLGSSDGTSFWSGLDAGGRSRAPLYRDEADARRLIEALNDVEALERCCFVSIVKEPGAEPYATRAELEAAGLSLVLRSMPNPLVEEPGIEASDPGDPLPRRDAEPVEPALDLSF